MLFIIHAYEDMYQGYHGIEDYDVVEIDTQYSTYEGVIDELSELGADMAYRVIEDYVYDEYQEQADSEGYSVDELIEENIQYIYFKVCDGVSIEEVANYLSSEGPNATIEEYGEEFNSL